MAENEGSKMLLTPRICVVGGGIAGVTCCSELIKAGFSNVLIFEAQSRLGGRIATHFDSDTEVDPYIIELGANWIHGTVNNPIFKIVRENNLLEMIPHTHKKPNYRSAYLTVQETGQEVAREIIKFVGATYHDHSKEADRFFKEGLPKQYSNRTNFQEYMLKECHKKFQESWKKFGHDKDEIVDLMMDLIRLNLSFETSISGCHSMTQVSLQQFGSYEYLKGGNPMIGQGYVKVVECVAKAIPGENIHLSTPVQSITWKSKPASPTCLYIDRFINRTIHSVKSGGNTSHERNTRIQESVTSNEKDNVDTCQNTKVESLSLNDKTCLDKTADNVKLLEQPCSVIKEENLLNSEENIPITSDETFSDNDPVQGITINLTDNSEHHFDHVIFTGSLGCLKHFQHTLFEPPLPRDKQKAINKLGIGVVDKIFLEFEHLDFLPKDVRIINLCWRKSSGVSDIPRWVKKIVHISVVDKPKDNMLMAWITGLEAEEMERLSDEEVGQGCVTALKHFLNTQHIPQPNRVIKTLWGSNPYTEGSYSYIPVGATVTEIETLIQPICDSNGKPVLQFAGEATHPKYYSTVHGAYLSGEREAQRLIDYYRNKQTLETGRCVKKQ